MFLRTGKCNQCGQCCGCGPSNKNPWPKGWPKSKPNLAEIWPLSELVSLTESSGIAEIDGKQLPWIWHEGLAKPDSQECAFLGYSIDGTRPCGLVGTSKEHLFFDYCKHQGPPETKTEAEVQAWRERHPDCGFEWEMLVDGKQHRNY